MQNNLVGQQGNLTSWNWQAGGKGRWVDEDGET